MLEIAIYSMQGPGGEETFRLRYYAQYITSHVSFIDAISFAIDKCFIILRAKYLSDDENIDVVAPRDITLWYYQYDFVARCYSYHTHGE